MTSVLREGSTTNCAISILPCQSVVPTYQPRRHPIPCPTMHRPIGRHIPHRGRSTRGSPPWSRTSRHLRSLVAEQTVPLSREAEGCPVRSEDRHGHPCTDESHHLDVASIPFRRQQRCDPLLEGPSFLTHHPIHQVHKRDEATTPLQARAQVLVLLLPRSLLQHLPRG